MCLDQDKFTDATSANGLSLANPPVCRLLIQGGDWTELRGRKTTGLASRLSAQKRGLCPRTVQTAQAASGFSPCLYKKLPELDLYPPSRLSQTPPFFHPPPNGHTFQEMKRVHRGLSKQIQWPALRSVGMSLTDMKQNCFMADDSLPSGGCGLARPRGRLAAPQGGLLWALPSAAWGHRELQPSPRTLPLLPRRASGGLKPEEGGMRRHKPDRPVSSLLLLITSLVQAAGKFLRKNHE